MARVRLRHDSAELSEYGPLIEISIGHSQEEIEAASNIGLDLPKPVRIKALIDTGARTTVLRPTLADRCKLMHTGFTRVATVGETGNYPDYAASITFPGTALRGFESMRVIACPLSQQPIACLIGRDILRHWTLTYDGKSGDVIIADGRP